MTDLVLSASVLLIVLVVLIKRLRPALWSPVYILIFIYLGTFGLGAIVLSIEGLASVPLGVTLDDSVEVLTEIAFLVAAFIVGVLVMRTTASTRVIRPTESIGVYITPTQSWVLLAIAFTAAICSVLGTGLSNVWDTSIYLGAIDEGLLLRISALLLWPSALGLGVVAGQFRKLRKLAALALFGVIWLYTIAIASRRMAVMPVIFCVGIFLAKPRSRRRKAILAVALLVVPLLQVTAIEFRQLPNMGVKDIPVLLAYMVASDPVAELATYIVNVVPTRVTLTTQRTGRSDLLAYLLFAFNPLPSFTSNSATLQMYVDESERIAWYEPYNAIGEILQGGIAIAIFYYFGVGLVFGYIENRFRRNHSGAIPLIQTCLCVAFTFFSLQYSLRTVNRFLYYSLAIGLVGTLIHRTRPRRDITQLGKHNSSKAPALFFNPGIVRRP